MIRAERFLISQRPYAVDLDSLTAKGDHTGGYGPYAVRAAWYRRRRGVTVSCLGELQRGFRTKAAPTDALDFLDRFTDGCYGGDCSARWDGSNLWTHGMPFGQTQTAQEFLSRMLDSFPDVPAGFDGWWIFGDQS